MTADKKQLWVPDEKIPERVKQMAWTLFVETYKSHVAGHGSWPGDEETYRGCLNKARIVFKIESGAATPKA